MPSSVCKCCSDYADRSWSNRDSGAECRTDRRWMMQLAKKGKTRYEQRGYSGTVHVARVDDDRPRSGRYVLFLDNAVEDAAVRRSCLHALDVGQDARGWP